MFCAKYGVLTLTKNGGSAKIRIRFINKEGTESVHNIKRKMIEDLRHVCIVVSDLDKSLKFYRDILGLVVFKITTLGGRYLEKVFNKKNIKLTYAKLRAPKQPKNRSAVLELHYWHRPKILPKPGYSHISFTVKDLDNEYNRLCRCGVKFISKPITSPNGTTKICFGYDPDNNLIEFIEDLLSTVSRT